MKKSGYFCKKIRMIIQLEITNPNDAELILSLVKRLNIPFKETVQASVEQKEREKAIERLRKFKSDEAPSFGDGLKWQIQEREDRKLPFENS
ncbi:MAG: hypothetical protein IT259_13335 [Saprospiraceae bacterium]|nr:hypothetical protein [Saprospiraceae bacterium]